MNIGQTIKEKARQIYSRLAGATWLEIVGIIAIGILILNSLFAASVNVKVTRKPLLTKILGQKQVAQIPTTNNQPASNAQSVSIDKEIEAKVLLSSAELPITWNDLGKQMVQTGVIDQAKFESLYSQRGGLDADMKKMLTESNNGKIIMTAQNSGTLLNLFWALGLGNKNEILDKGEMWDKQYGGDAAKFASTGGWTLATGNIMDHYSKHQLMMLNSQQQATVDRVSKGIFRPCCGNSTHFPDCNHGMAMLGLLELMASQGVDEGNINKYALAVNAYWFPDTYLTIASYLKTQGKDYAKVAPQELLSAQYSSAQGYKQILNQVQPVQGKSGGGCGV